MDKRQLRKTNSLIYRNTMNLIKVLNQTDKRFIILFNCVAGSGKTYISNLIEKNLINKNKFANLSRDKIRFSSLNYDNTGLDFLQSIDSEIKIIENKVFKHFNENDYNIILDSNLTEYHAKFDEINQKYYFIIIRLSNVKRAIYINSERKRVVPKNIMKTMIDNFQINTNELIMKIYFQNRTILLDFDECFYKITSILRFFDENTILKKV